MEGAIFTKILEHGETVGIEGTTFHTLCDYLQDELNIDFNHSDHIQKRQSLKHLFDECFRHSHGEFHVLQTEYYFRLIEHREIQQARQAALKADNNAWIAIRLSFLAIIFCLIVAGIQIFSPTKIDKQDLQALIDSNSVRQEVKLDSLQMAQILSAIESSQPAPVTQKPKKAILPSNEVQHHELINKYYEEE